MHNPRNTHLGLPFASWTLDRLVAYLGEEKGVGMGRTRVAEVLSAEGLRWRKQEGWFGERVDPEFADALWAAQLAAQEKLAKKFPGAEHITDTNSTHYIQLENPQLVSDSIRQVVDADRDGAKTVGAVEGAD